MNVIRRDPKSCSCFGCVNLPIFLTFHDFPSHLWYFLLLLLLLLKYECTIMATSARAGCLRLVSEKEEEEEEVFVTKDIIRRPVLPSSCLREGGGGGVRYHRTRTRRDT